MEKRIKIAQAEGLDWKNELRRYVTKYRGLPQTTTGKSPAELMFNRQIKGKLPDLNVGSRRNDLKKRDRDAEQRSKMKSYADQRRNAKVSGIEVGDIVLLKQEKSDKFSTTFEPDPYTVISKNGSNVVLQSSSGTVYSRNSSHIKKYIPATEGNQTETSLTQEPEKQARPTRDKKAPLKYNGYVTSF